jgi:septal ring factor EnvC (AmiA/AmiB activator)
MAGGYRYHFLASVLLLYSPFVADATGEKLRLNVNPIRRVVTMLQMMQKKVEEQGHKEQELFDAFMCYCKTGVESLETSIKENDAKVSQLESSIEETEASLKQLKSDLESAKADRVEAEDTMDKATALREKEAKTFDKFSSESKTDISAMTKAILAIEKGVDQDFEEDIVSKKAAASLVTTETRSMRGTAASFLQSREASVVKRLAVSMDISDADRDVLASFFSNNQESNSGYAPSSGEIVGILKQMKETMEKELAEATKAEEASIKDYEGLMAAKKKQVVTLTKEIEAKMVRQGESGVQLANMKDDLEDTEKSLAQEQKFLVDVTKNCKTKEAEKEVNDKLRADELLALADTIKILNDDDALELFKKTLPTPSLLQLTSSSKATRKRALEALRAGNKRRKHDYRLNLISLALRGKKVSFEKVIAMIDGMSALLVKEQGTDNDKKAYCEKSLDETEEELKELTWNIKDLEKAIDAHEEDIKATTAELESLTTGIKTLDKQVAEATTNRKEEHAEYEETMASDGAAKELLAMAKNRLNKFYSPKLYVPEPKRELTEEERISVNMGGTMAPTAAPGGIAGTGVTAAFAQYEDDAQEQDSSIGFLQLASRSRAKAKAKAKAIPPPPPETAGAYKKAGQSSNGVIAMIDVLEADLEKEMQTMKVEEADAQKDYEEFIKDSADKRSDDAKSISDKEGYKVELEGNLLKLKQEKKGKTAEKVAKIETLGDLHGECDWLIQNYEARKVARTQELESLSSAKAVLSGADYSFLQISRHH